MRMHRQTDIRGIRAHLDRMRGLGDKITCTHADDPATDDQHALGHRFERECTGRIDYARIVRDERQLHGLRAGGDDRVIELHHLATAVFDDDLDVVGIEKTLDTFDHLHLALFRESGQAAVFGTAAAATAPASPSPDNARMQISLPSEALSPTASFIASITPACGDGMSIEALSDHSPVSWGSISDGSVGLLVVSSRMVARRQTNAPLTTRETTDGTWQADWFIDRPRAGSLRMAG